MSPDPDSPASVPDDSESTPVIDLFSDTYFMGEALRQAIRAWEAGEVPIGCVIVRQGRIIARAFNQVEMLKDATAHAEMLAISQAQQAVGDWRLNDCTLYVTKEPCPMCAGAVELLVGLWLTFGIFIRLIIVIAWFPFNLTLTHFNWVELIGHLPFYGLLAVLLVQIKCNTIL